MNARNERMALSYLTEVGLIAETAGPAPTRAPVTLDAPGLFDLSAPLDAAPDPPMAPLELRCPACTGLLAEATGVCTECGADPLGYYCDELDHDGCAHTR